MLNSLIAGLMLAGLMFAGAENEAVRGKPTPIMRAVAPEEAKTGDVLSISGEHLEKAHVAEVYLTVGEDNFKLQVVSQTADKIEAKIPANVKAGRLRLMVLTAGAGPQYLEQPVVVEVK